MMNSFKRCDRTQRSERASLSPDGHCRGRPRIERDIRYVVQLDDGRQETLTPEEFTKRFGWKNDPDKVGLAVAAKPAPTPAPAANANLDPDRRAAERVLQLGGTVTIIMDGKEFVTVDKDLPARPFEVFTIHFLSTRKFTDDELKRLPSLKKLVALTVGGTAITDAGLEKLADFHELRTLNFERTATGDAGLAHVRALVNLQQIDLDKTLVTNAGLVHLKGLDQLKRIGLTGTAVSDAGLEHLQKLPNLQQLRLEGTKVTPAGVAALQKALPSCKIAWDGGVKVPTKK